MAIIGRPRPLKPVVPKRRLYSCSGGGPSTATIDARIDDEKARDPRPLRRRRLQQRGTPAQLGREQHGERAGREACVDAVGPAGQDDRHAGADDDPRRLGVRHEYQLLHQHVAGLEIRHHQDVTMPLVFAASSSMALSKASGPSIRPPLIWPRSAILQSAAASMVEGIFGVTVSTAERIATLGLAMPMACASSIAF